MVRIENAEIDRIRANADIVDVISHYTRVEKKGKRYKCICPFHDDHDPSMTISPDMQIYKCFVCGAGGNVFTFVQNFEKVSFVEAVSTVAEITGQTLSVSPVSVSTPVDPHIDALHRVLNETISYTTYQLENTVGDSAREYLEKRGLDRKTRETFQIGYNPPGNALSMFLQKKGYSLQDCIGSNVSMSSGGGLRDMFEGRIMFPIHDAYGKPIGFSARSMDPSDPSKYKNTIETDIFRKGNIVYNYHRAARQARHAGKIYVCEGVTDVIAFHRAGLENAVCTLGTSCTSTQIALLKKAAARIVFCYDGDHAGQAATFRAGKMALSQDCDISVVLNKTGKDPDEIIAADGAQGLKNLVSKELAWMEFVLDYLASETNMNSYLDKKQMAEKAMMEINALRDESEKEYFTQQLSQMTGFHLRPSRQETVPSGNTMPLGRTVPSGLEQAEDQILSMMLNSVRAVTRFEEELGYLLSRDGQTLAMMMIDEVHTKGSCDPASLMDKTADESIRSRIGRLAYDDPWMNEYDPAKLDGAIRAIKIRLLDEQASQYRDQLTQALNGTAMQALMEKYNECLKEKRRLIEQEKQERIQEDVQWQTQKKL